MKLVSLALAVLSAVAAVNAINLPRPQLGSRTSSDTNSIASSNGNSHSHSGGSVRSSGTASSGTGSILLRGSARNAAASRRIKFGPSVKTKDSPTKDGIRRVADYDMSNAEKNTDIYNARVNVKSERRKEVSTASKSSFPMFGKSAPNRFQ
jgi:hypothetical protein